MVGKFPLHRGGLEHFEHSYKGKGFRPDLSKSNLGS